MKPLKEKNKRQSDQLDLSEKTDKRLKTTKDLSMSIVDLTSEDENAKVETTDSLSNDLKVNWQSTDHSLSPLSTTNDKGKQTLNKNGIQEFFSIFSKPQSSTATLSQSNTAVLDKMTGKTKLGYKNCVVCGLLSTLSRGRCTACTEFHKKHARDRNDSELMKLERLRAKKAKAPPKEKKFTCKVCTIQTTALRKSKKCDRCERFCEENGRDRSQEEVDELIRKREVKRKVHEIGGTGESNFTCLNCGQTSVNVRLGECRTCLRYREKNGTVRADDDLLRIKERRKLFSGEEATYLTCELCGRENLRFGAGGDWNGEIVGTYRGGLFLCYKPCQAKIVHSGFDFNSIKERIDKSSCRLKENGNCAICRKDGKVYSKIDETVDRCEYCYNLYVVMGSKKYALVNSNNHTDGLKQTLIMTRTVSLEVDDENLRKRTQFVIDHFLF